MYMMRLVTSRVLHRSGTMKESTIQKQIIDYLHDLGAWTVKTIQSNKAGVPDIIACLDGSFLALEVKRDAKAKVSALQRRTIKQIEAAGGVAAIVTSLNQVKELLNGKYKKQ